MHACMIQLNNSYIVFKNRMKNFKIRFGKKTKKKEMGGKGTLRKAIN
jgi:hypothetical protein